MAQVQTLMLSSGPFSCLNFIIYIKIFFGLFWAGSAQGTICSAEDQSGVSICKTTTFSLCILSSLAHLDSK